jgi:hypothetical protein
MRSQWVSRASARAASDASSRDRAASAIGAARMTVPFPAVRAVRSCSRSAFASASAAERTPRRAPAVVIPMSFGPPAAYAA